MNPALYIPGPEAKRCLDCNGIHNASSCPGCGSRASWPEDAWLERRDTKLMMQAGGGVVEIWKDEAGA